MDDNNLVTHGLHWLTQSVDGWECANPDCWWNLHAIVTHERAQHMFDLEHPKLSDQAASVQP